MGLLSKLSGTRQERPVRRLPSEFDEIKRLAVDRARRELEELDHERQRIEGMVRQRQRQITSMAPKVKRVVGMFSEAMAGDVKERNPKEWGSVNLAWRATTRYGGVDVQTWPWMQESARPRILKGLWIRYLGPDGKDLVSEAKTKGRKLAQSYELGSHEASHSGYYHWIQTYDGTDYDFHAGPSVFGYFLAMSDFTEERLAHVLHEAGFDLLRRLKGSDFFSANGRK